VPQENVAKMKSTKLPSEVIESITA
jgi:hypothetical protein